MNPSFPAVDPIPLPAPVWLFKLLNIVTLSLHFAAMQMMVGGLLLFIVFNFLGQRSGAAASLRLQVSDALAHRLPVVMTYVINLGVPPLLFTQVLYGRALYTSSVLIGVWWFAVIVILTFAYWLLYRQITMLNAGKPAWHLAIVSYILVVFIGRIYAVNMTLMLRPEVWKGLYESSAFGMQLPADDPTTTPRWLFLMTGGIGVAGLWLMWLAPLTKHYTDDVKVYMNQIGGRIALVGLVLHAVFAGLVFYALPDTVKVGLTTETVYVVTACVWVAMAAVLVGLAAASAFAVKPSKVITWGVTGAALVVTIAMVTYRDGIRDLTLLGKGFDVWDRVIVTNWSVVGLFLVLFVVGLGVIGWLASVVYKARPVPNTFSLKSNSPAQESKP